MTPAEVVWGKALAEERTKRNRAAGASNRLVVTDGELRGVLGEMAFAKYAGVIPNLLSERWLHSVDCHVGPLRVDVKCSIGFRLLVEQVKEGDDVDVYVLVHQEAEDTYTMEGWAYSWRAWQAPIEEKVFGEKVVRSHVIHAVDLFHVGALLELGAILDGG